MNTYKYMVQMWNSDGKGIDTDDVVWYHPTPKIASMYARGYLNQKDGGIFTVLRVFNGGHYRTIDSDRVDGQGAI